MHLATQGRDHLLATTRAQEPPVESPVLGMNLGDEGCAWPRLLRRERRGRLARPRTEDQDLGERVGAQPVGAIDAHARGLAGRVEPREWGGAVNIGMNAPHHVMDDRPDGEHPLCTDSITDLTSKLPPVTALR